MRILYLTIFLCFITLGVSTQTVLNGDFENHQASDCEFNLDNVEYNALMENSTAFGPNDEVDLQHKICGFAAVPSNEWFVSLSKRPTGAFDAISLKLSENLTQGETYKISYWEYAADTLGNANIPLSIGLSTDPNNFGTEIHNSLPLPGIWTQRSFSFIAPNSGGYLTLSVNSPGIAKGWNFLDNFEFLEVSNTLTNLLDSEVKVYPNPSKGEFRVDVPSDVTLVQIFNISGQLVLSRQVANGQPINLNLETDGMYFLKAQTANNSITLKLVVSK